MIAALDGVRSTPTLAAWFGEASVGTASELAGASEVVEAMAAAFLGGADDEVADADTRERARWLVRVVVSLLTMPAASRGAERRLVERFVVPVVLG